MGKAEAAAKGRAKLEAFKAKKASKGKSGQGTAGTGGGDDGIESADPPAPSPRPPSPPRPPPLPPPLAMGAKPPVAPAPAPEPVPTWQLASGTPFDSPARKPKPAPEPVAPARQPPSPHRPVHRPPRPPPPLPPPPPATSTRDGGVGIQASKTSSRVDANLDASSKPSRPSTFSSYEQLSDMYRPRASTARSPNEHAPPLANITLGGDGDGIASGSGPSGAGPDGGGASATGSRTVTRVEDAMTAEEMMERATEAAARARAELKKKAAAEDEKRRRESSGASSSAADELPAFTSPFRSKPKNPFKTRPTIREDVGGAGRRGRDNGGASTSSRVSLGGKYAAGTMEGRNPHPGRDDDEVARLQKVVEEMTEERLAFQRAHARQNELMQQLADENETATSRANALTSELGAVRERLERRENEVIAQGAVVSQLAAERDAAIKRATHAVESARSTSMESVELEERCRQLKMETVKLRRELDEIRDDRERTDRALRAAAADRSEMRTSLNAMQDERMHLQSALRRMAAQEEAEMERGAADWNGEAPENTPNPTPQKNGDAGAAAAKRAARLADELGVAFDGVGGGRVSSNGNGDVTRRDGEGATNGGASHGVFSHMSRSMNGVPLGGVPVEKVGEDQLRLVDSIHALLTEVEEERSRARAALAASRRKMDELQRRNVELEKRLGDTVQRLELEVSKELGAKMREASEDEARHEAIDGGEYEYAEDGARVYTASDGTKHYVYEDTPRAGGILSYLNPFARRR